MRLARFVDDMDAFSVVRALFLLVHVSRLFTVIFSVRYLLIRIHLIIFLSHSSYKVHFSLLCLY